MMNDEINELISRLPAADAVAGGGDDASRLRQSIKGDSTNYVA